jgi:hypothetical protein
MTPLLLALAIMGHHHPLHWTGNNQDHVIAHAAGAYVGSWMTNSRAGGVAMTMGVGLFKEVWDENHGGSFSTHDIGLNLMGALAGAWLYTPRKRFGFDGRYAYITVKF